MVLEALREGLSKATASLRKALVVDKQAVKDYVRELQRALLVADVSVDLVLELSKRIEDRVLAEKPPPGLTRRENALRITYEELVRLLQAGEKKELKGKILLVGLYGSGKTTTAAKLAKLLKRRGLNPKLLCTDLHRPAAREQLKQLGEELRVPYWAEPKRSVEEIVREGLRELDNGLVIVDSSGRHTLDDELMEELRTLKRCLEPNLTLLVLDATIGQQAYSEAKRFNEAVGIDGVILTKLDGSAKGGGAISACAAAGVPVYFVGTGERLDELEEFEAKGFVSRLLGTGDLEALLKKVEELEASEEVVERIARGEFTLRDLRDQISQLQRLGPFRKVLDLLPFASSIPKDALALQEEKLRVYKVIMDSMTKEELENPEILDKSRIERIARGSGRKPEEVRELLQCYRRVKKVMRSLTTDRRMRALAKRLGLEELSDQTSK